MTATAEANLIFNWGPPRRRARALVLFLFASLFLHAFCFYLFQIVYPPTVALAPPPARLALISNRTEDGRSFLRWIDAEDPALIGATLRPPNSKTRELPKLEHIPSYMMNQPQLKPLPPMTVDLRPPSPQPPGPVPAPHRITPVQPSSAPSAVAFSEEIDALGPATFPSGKFSASSKDQPENIRFRIAVNPNGQVQYAFPLNSSGDASLDAEARHHLTLGRFPVRPGQPNERLVWGIATVEWGADITRPTATPTPTPSPSPPPP
jgi:hypothetical protein